MASAVMVAGLGIAGAGSASSAINYTCASISGLTAVVTNGSPASARYSADVDFAAGDTLTATWSNISGTPGGGGSALYLPTDRQVVASSTPTATMSYTVTALDLERGDWTADFRAVLSGSISSATVTITCGNPSSTAVNALAIPAWVQAYGIFRQDDACEAGWANSWQKWAEPVTGGWVCTRSIPSLG